MTELRQLQTHGNKERTIKVMLKKMLCVKKEKKKRRGLENQWLKERKKTYSTFRLNNKNSTLKDKDTNSVKSTSTIIL